MAQPTPYNRLTSFSNLSALSPSTPPPGNDLDAEYNAIKTTLDAILVDLALIQNDDTTLKNASVGPAQLSSQLTAGFTAPTAWVTGTAYTASPASCVLQSSKMYICLVSHTSGVFATDLAAGKWLQIFDLTAISLGTASQVAVSAHGTNVVTNVQTSLNNLEDNKAATSHTHTASQISDSTADGRAFLTATLASQKTLLGLGALAFLNSVSITAVTAQLAFTGKITPAAINSTTDWNPTGWATAVVIEVSTTADNVTLSGMLATSDGDIKILDNVGTTNLTILPGVGSAANQVTLPRPMVLRPGQSAVFKYDGTATKWRLQSPVPTSPLPGASFKNLYCGNAGARNGFTAPGTPNSQFLITYDELILEDGQGETWRVTSGSHTISTATTGAVNGLESAFSLVSAKIFVWVIGNPTSNTIGGLMSLSATAPTLPSGYTFKARVGATFTDGSSNLVRTLQQGRQLQYVTDGTHAYPTIASGSAGTINLTTFTGVSTSTATTIPTTASIGKFLISSNASSMQLGLGPNANFAGPQSVTPVPIYQFFTTGESPVMGELMLESANVFYASGGASGLVQVVGWTDNI